MAREPRHDRDFANMDDAAIVKQVIQDKTASESYQAQFFTEFDEYYKQYRSYIDEDTKTKKKEQARSCLFIPYTFQVVETILPKLVLSMFRSRPFIQTMPLGVNDNVIRLQRAEKMNKLLDYQFYQKMRLFEVMLDVIKSMIIYGTAITKQGWRFETSEVVKRVPKTILGIEIPGETTRKLIKTVTHDHPYMNYIPIKDFLFDPSSSTVHGGRYCIYRHYMDYYELMRLIEDSPEGTYKNIDALRKYKDSGMSTATRAFETHEQSRGIVHGSNNTRELVIEEHWQDGWVAQVVNDDVLILNQENPFDHKKKPFTKWIDCPVPGEFYGIGCVEPIVSLQDELNTTRNQRIDNVSLIMNKMYKILKGAGIDTKQLISRPGGFIEVDAMDDVTEMKFDDVTASSYNEESVIKNDMDFATGVFDASRGSSPQRRETATTMSILAEASSERFKVNSMYVEYTGIHDSSNQIIRLNQQYIDRDTEVIILGEDGTAQPDVVTPEDIMGEWDIMAIGSALEPAVNKEQRQTQLVQLYNIIQQRPDVNHIEVLKRIFESFDMKNIDAIFNVQPQQPQTEQVVGEPNGNITNLGGQLDNVPQG